MWQERVGAVELDEPFTQTNASLNSLGERDKEREVVTLEMHTSHVAANFQTARRLRRQLGAFGRLHTHHGPWEQPSDVRAFDGVEP